MFPAPDPIPCFVEYDSRGTRTRKHFDEILSPEARWFYAAKSRAGKNPVLKRADGHPAHVSAPAEPDPPVYVQYDGSRVIKGVRRRVLRRFKDGLTREAKEFFLAKAREGKYPTFLASDLSPVFGRGSKYRKPEPEPEFADRVLTQGVLFDASPDQLPD